MSNENQKKTYKLKINSGNYDWPEQYITGAQVRQLDSIQAEDDIYLKRNGQDQDQLISGDTRVDLGEPGVEQFYSTESQKSFKIVVNGQLKDWEKKQISFQEVIVLAFGSYIDVATMVYTVAYEDGPKQNPEGSMVKGSIVFVKNKMIFHATQTDKS